MHYFTPKSVWVVVILLVLLHKFFVLQYAQILLLIRCTYRHRYCKR